MKQIDDIDAFLVSHQMKKLFLLFLMLTMVIGIGKAQDLQLNDREYFE